MLSKEDWIASHRKQFPDARPDVLGFIYDFSSRSSDLYEVFVNGYCFYFANMLREAFNGGDVCWSVGRGHVVWVDDNDVAYDISGVYYDFDQLVSVDYLGALVNDFKHNGWKYTVPDSRISKWCAENKVLDITAVSTLWKCIPTAKLDFTQTVESDAIKYWDNYVGQLVVHNGNVYTVDSLVERLPYSIRKCYSSNRECVLSNLNILFD